MDRLHPVLINAVESILKAVFHERQLADKSIERCLKSNKKFGSRDRAFVAKYAYDIIRHYRRLISKLDIPYQSFEFPVEKMINILSDSNDIDSATFYTEDAVGYSFPDWLFSRYEDSLQERFYDEMKYLNRPAPMYLRVNKSRIKVSELINKIEINHGVKSSEMMDACLKIEKVKNITAWPEFKNGFFEIQDRGSQMIAPMLELSHGLTVIDACAGAGGKTVHIADLMEGTGRIIAMDIAQFKLDELDRRVSRAEINNVESHLLIKAEQIDQFDGIADRLLLDVPCSGSGVLRRKVDAKWKMEEPRIEELKSMQRKILSDYSKMLKAGGVMVYATCSLFKDENQNQIDWFLINFGDQFELKQMTTIYPSEYDCDGFFMASLRKK